MSNEENFHDLIRSNHLFENLIQQTLSPSVSDSGDFTEIVITYQTNIKYDYDWWINIHEETYILEAFGTEKSKMIEAKNIPLHPERLYLTRKHQTHTFTLIFPKIPDYWKGFDLHEFSPGESDTLHIFGFKKKQGKYFANI